jgi:hypothetical protein
MHLAKAAEHVLLQPGQRISEAIKTAPVTPGLYAVHADKEIWKVLGLDLPSDRRPPLYIGKSETSLLSQNVATNFDDGRTGSSTLRRSLAGLLSVKLDLNAIPRNASKPSDFDRYSLEEAGDRRLTEWMCEYLRLTVWTAPTYAVLGPLKIEVLKSTLPPLNLKQVDTPWSGKVSDARKRMAAQARANAKQ